jgi:hypothetical protein
MMKVKLSPLFSLVAAALCLNAMLKLDYPSDQWLTARLLLPSPDLWLLLVVLAATASWSRLTPWTWVGAWVLFVGLRLFRFADVAVPIYLNRPFNLYIDLGYLYGLYDLLKTSSRDGDFQVLAVMITAAALGVLASSWFLFLAVAKALARPLLRQRFLALSAFLVGALLILGGGVTVAMVGEPVLSRLGQELCFIMQVKERQRALAVVFDQTARSRKRTTPPLTRLEGADLLLFLVESYGRTVYTRPEYRPAMAQVMARFGQVLADCGLVAVSSYLTATTFGGSSWLSHGTLEGGLAISDDLDYKALLRSQVPPMASFFRQAGYRTVSAMPGTRFPFPEGAYFGYEQTYYAKDLGYQGRTFGFSPMPDQFVLDRVRRLEFVQRERPLFVRYVLTSSHASYSLQPPVLAWDDIGEGHLFWELNPVSYPILWPNLTNAGPAYLHSLDYDFQVLGEYLSRYLPDNSLVVILGDHQPNRQLTDQDEPWSVPIHVISRNPRLLAPFRKRGYTPGLLPAQPLPHPGIETLLPGLLEDFSVSP